MALLVLHETALGYSLFSVEEVDDIGIELEAVQAAVEDLAKFGKICKLKAFVPFRSAQDALDNINAISEGVMHDFLKDFLETNLPKAKAGKKSKVKLGVADHRIGQAISDQIDFPCLHTDAVPELLRGIRRHFEKMVKSITDTHLNKAQLGLGHSYSRAKVKFNVHRQDNMIIQAISLLDQLDKDVNTFSMRIKEWYGYHFPELVKIVVDNYLYAKVCQQIKRRSSMTEDSLAALEAILMNSAQAQQVVDASRSSMGMEISDIDLLNIDSFSSRVVSLTEYRRGLHEYLQTKMTAVAPNLSSLIGEQVGARLISHAGSLTNLAKYPASTVQILGAEKALFRALKTKGNTPKYGLIFHSSFIGRAAAKNKGRISRYVANKAVIASRIDCFSEVPTDKFGIEMKEQVEERLRFYETGEAPRKNVDVMSKVASGLPGATAAAAPSSAKKTKKDKKRKATDDEEEAAVEVDTPSKKTKKEKKEKKAKKSKSNDSD